MRGLRTMIRELEEADANWKREVEKMMCPAHMVNDALVAVAAQHAQIHAMVAQMCTPASVMLASYFDDVFDEPALETSKVPQLHQEPSSLSAPIAAPRIEIAEPNRNQPRSGVIDVSWSVLTPSRHETEVLSCLRIPNTPAGRRSIVDRFLERVAEQANILARRKDIGVVARHKTMRQFYFWQSCDPKATKQDNITFPRIVRMSSTEFKTALENPKRPKRS